MASLSRKLHLQQSSWPLLEDLVFCSERWPRVAELAAEGLFEQQAALPPVPVDPELEALMPYGGQPASRRVHHCQLWWQCIRAVGERPGRTSSACTPASSLPSPWWWRCSRPFPSAASPWAYLQSFLIANACFGGDAFALLADGFAHKPALPPVPGHLPADQGAVATAGAGAHQPAGSGLDGAALAGRG